MIFLGVCGVPVIVWRTVFHEGNLLLLLEGEHRDAAVEGVWILLNDPRARHGIEEGVAGLVCEDVPGFGILPKRPLLVRGEHRVGGGNDRAPQRLPVVGMLVGQIPPEEDELRPGCVATDLLGEEHPVAVIGGGDADDVVIVAGDVEENLAEGQLRIRALHAGIEPGQDVAGIFLVHRWKPEDRAIGGADWKLLLALAAGGIRIGVAHLGDPGGEGVIGAVEVWAFLLFLLVGLARQPLQAEQCARLTQPGDLRFLSVDPLEIVRDPLPHRRCAEDRLAVGEVASRGEGFEPLQVDLHGTVVEDHGIPLRPDRRVVLERQAERIDRAGEYRPEDRETLGGCGVRGVRLESLDMTEGRMESLPVDPGSDPFADEVNEDQILLLRAAVRLRLPEDEQPGPSGGGFRFFPRQAPPIEGIAMGPERLLEGIDLKIEAEADG